MPALKDVDLVGETIKSVDFNDTVVQLTFDTGQKVQFRREGKESNSRIMEKSEAWRELRERTIGDVTLTEYVNEVPIEYDEQWPPLDAKGKPEPTPDEYRWSVLEITNPKGTYKFIWLNVNDGTHPRGAISIVETRPADKTKAKPA